MVPSRASGRSPDPSARAPAGAGRSRRAPSLRGRPAVVRTMVMASPAQPAPALPEARGPISSAVLMALARAPGQIDAPDVAVGDVLADDDLQLALYCCYELHYRSFRGVDPCWEWNPELIEARRRLEHLFERAASANRCLPRRWHRETSRRRCGSWSRRTTAHRLPVRSSGMPGWSSSASSSYIGPPTS